MKTGRTINTIVIGYIEERLHEIEEETSYGYTLCCQSGYHALHAVPNFDIEEAFVYDEAVIETAFRKYFTVESYYEGEIYFDIIPQEWERLERKMKIQHVLS